MQILDISIPDMDTVASETAIRKILIDLHGVRDFKQIKGGMEIAYREERVAPDQICEALHEGGYHPSVLHDSHSF